MAERTSSWQPVYAGDAIFGICAVARFHLLHLLYTCRIKNVKGLVHRFLRGNFANPPRLRVPEATEVTRQSDKERSVSHFA